MKIVYCLVICLGLVHCRDKTPKSYDYTLDDIGGRLAFYIEAVGDIRSTMQRCDGLTFLGLWTAYGDDYNIYRHEYEPGEWHRDVKPCYPDDSRSEISTEGVLGALHAMTARGDDDKLEDLWAYLEANDWIAGDGPKEYTRVLQLRPLFKEIRKKVGLVDQDKHKVVRFAGENEDASIGYRGNVLADYIALHHMALGYIESWHFAAIEELVESVPQSPLYQALYGCYESEKAYQTALNILGDDGIFPKDALPEPHLEGLWDWSQAPQLPLYAFTYRLLESCSE